MVVGLYVHVNRASWDVGASLVHSSSLFGQCSVVASDINITIVLSELLRHELEPAVVSLH